MYCWLILICGILLGICTMGIATIMNLMLPFIRENLGISNTQSTLLSTIRQLTVVLSTLVMDRYFQKLGIRLGTFVAFVCGALSAFLFGIAGNYAVCVLASILCGVSFGLGGAMPIALMMKNWFVKYRGLMVGISAAGSGLTTAVMSRPITAAIQANGLRAGGRLALIMMLVGAAFFVIVFRNKPSDVGTTPFEEGYVAQSKQKKYIREDPKPMGRSAALILIVLGFCIGMPGFTLLGNFTLATTTMGYDSMVVANALALNGVIGIFGKMIYGFICDILGAVKTTMLYFAGVSAACICLLACNGVDTALLYIGAMLLGFCLFPISTVGFALWSSDLTTEKDYAGTLKKLQSMNVLGGLVFLTVPGMIADLCGSYKPAYFVDLACYVIAAICMITLYRKYAGRRIRVAPSGT